MLGISAGATTEEIKSAFHDLALRYHPDKNGGNLALTEYFLLIREAYEILADVNARREYDQRRHRETRRTSKTGDRRTANSHKDISTEEILEHFRERVNCLLWNIEDFVCSCEPYYVRSTTKKSGISDTGLLDIIIFFDKWLLAKSGYADNFSTARRIDEIDMHIYQDEILSGTSKVHLPYSSIQDYFYNIRLRANEMLRKVKISDLAYRDPESGLTIGEIWLKVEGYLNSILSNAGGTGVSESKVLVEVMGTGWMKRKSET